MKKQIISAILMSALVTPALTGCGIAASARVSVSMMSAVKKRSSPVFFAVFFAMAVSSCIGSAAFYPHLSDIHVIQFSIPESGGGFNGFSRRIGGVFHRVGGTFCLSPIARSDIMA